MNILDLPLLMGFLCHRHGTLNHKQAIMPVWCPECNAQLPEGLEKCPRCEAQLGTIQPEGGPGFNRSDIFWYSAYTIGIVLIPIVIGVIIGLICIFLFLANSGFDLISSTTNAL